MFQALLLAVATEELAAQNWRDGPPPGPSTWGYCPVTGKNVSVASAFQVNFVNGQKLYVADAAAAAAYRAAPQAFWLSPHESPLPMPDGMRGLPDFRGQAFKCPRSGENITVDMKTPRVVHRHGQSVYFCCFGCVTAFWLDPTSLIAIVTAR